MANIPTQYHNRTGRLATPLGKDKLCLVRFEGAEAMGELFEFRVEAVSLDADIDFNEALGKTCSVHLETADNVGRDFGGVLTEALWVGTRLDLQVYYLVLRPWLWLLSLRSDCRIFSNMSPKDIIKEALGNSRFGPMADITTEDYPTLEYTVQYRETDLDFALRLMEKYGIYFYFAFARGDGVTPSEHKLVLADSTTYQSLPRPSDVLYLPPTVAGRRDIQQFTVWAKLQGMVAGVFELNDYDYNHPSRDLLAHCDFPYAYDRGSHAYDYTGGYEETALGQRLTRVRLDADRRGERCRASGYAPSLTPGYAIKRTSTDSDSQDGTYLILRCSHLFGDQSYVSAGLGAADFGESYSGKYELSRHSIPYRMPLRTHRPAIIGTQPAKVISKERQEIDVDNLGRVLVEFYWDAIRPGKPRRMPSRRVRVGQFWARPARGAVRSARRRRGDGGL